MKEIANVRFQIFIVCKTRIKAYKHFLQYAQIIYTYGYRNIYSRTKIGRESQIQFIMSNILNLVD